MKNIARIEKQRELALCYCNAFVYGVVDTVIWLADKAQVKDTIEIFQILTGAVVGTAIDNNLFEADIFCLRQMRQRGMCFDYFFEVTKRDSDYAKQHVFIFTL